MGTSAIPAYGTLLQLGDGGTPENFTTIAEVRDIGGPELGLDTVDVTSHDSPGAWEELIATIKRSGSVTFGINYIPTGATHDATTGLIASFAAKTRENFKLVFPDGLTTTWAFAAYVVGLSPSAPVAGELSASVTLKLTGQPTLA